MGEVSSSNSRRELSACAGRSAGVCSKMQSSIEGSVESLASGNTQPLPHQDVKGSHALCYTQGKLETGLSRVASHCHLQLRREAPAALPD